MAIIEIIKYIEILSFNDELKKFLAADLLTFIRICDLIKKILNPKLSWHR